MAHVRKEQDSQHGEQDIQLTGTFASVLILGGFLAVTWLVVFIIFIVRNGG